MDIKEIYNSLNSNFKITDKKSFKLINNIFENLKDKKITVTEYSINENIYFVDKDDKVYQLIENSLCPNLAIKIGYIKKKTIFIYNKYKKN